MFFSWFPWFSFIRGSQIWYKDLWYLIAYALDHLIRSSYKSIVTEASLLVLLTSLDISQHFYLRSSWLCAGKLIVLVLVYICWLFSSWMDKATKLSSCWRIGSIFIWSFLLFHLHPLWCHFPLLTHASVMGVFVTLCGGSWIGQGSNSLSGGREGLVIVEAPGRPRHQLNSV